MRRSKLRILDEHMLPLGSYAGEKPTYIKRPYITLPSQILRRKRKGLLKPLEDWPTTASW